MEKKRFISPEKTRELQNDWQGYGRMSVTYGLVVLIIIILAVLLRYYFGIG
ncbi:MAG: hypothetical protein LUH02_07285 [Erysipelotrichaceae bacterium]|nr:hypothetical protein [Erysipelotrichaceae bacterium]